MFNVVVVVLAAVIFSVLAFSLSSINYYYLEIETGLTAKAKTATEFFANYITVSEQEFYQRATRYTEEFNDRDKIELQFIDTNGKLVVSTYGKTANSEPGTQDITGALKSGKISVFRGKSPVTGERIIAVSSPMIYSNGEVIGIMRYVCSLGLVDRQVAISLLTAIGLGFAAIVLVLFFCTMFIRSITEPIKEISHVAKRIAEGSYGVKIETEYPDEIGELAETINQISMQISRSEKVKSEFISSVSHELRTPLTAITGWGETLIYDGNLSGVAQQGIEIILNEARRLTTMVEELLEFTRMEDGRFTLNVEEIDPIAVLEDTIFTYGEILRHEEIQLQYTPCEEETPNVMGDPERLKQVFLNILDNAAKYGREGKRIQLSGVVENENVVIRFRDYGLGIPEDELANVKMKFYKGSSKERGSGIGLSVCEEIVGRHNGALILENAEGGGLLVTIRLPVH